MSYNPTLEAEIRRGGCLCWFGPAELSLIWSSSNAVSQNEAREYETDVSVV